MPGNTTFDPDLSYAALSHLVLTSFTYNGIEEAINRVQKAKELIGKIEGLTDENICTLEKKLYKVMEKNLNISLAASIALKDSWRADRVLDDFSVQAILLGYDTKKRYLHTREEAIDLIDKNLDTTNSTAPTSTDGAFKGMMRLIAETAEYSLSMTAPVISSANPSFKGIPSYR